MPEIIEPTQPWELAKSFSRAEVLAKEFFPSFKPEGRMPDDRRGRLFMAGVTDVLTMGHNCPQSIREVASDQLEDRAVLNGLQLVINTENLAGEGSS